MNQKENYDLFLKNVIKSTEADNKRKSLLLHVCCAPCSSYVLEYLNKYFDITVYFYNPNIDEPHEYRLRADEEKRFIEEMNFENKVVYTEGDYNIKEFYDAVKGLEDLKEGSARCVKCFELRLESAAKRALEGGFDYFTTTLSISPLKSSTVLNELGKKLGEKYGIAYLCSDFKKNNGYKRSVELSREHSLYRQSFCGCSFSKKQAEEEGRL